MYTEMEKLVHSNVLEPAFAGSFFCLILHINGERKIPGQQKVIRGSNIQALTSHASLNPRSKRASLSLTASPSAFVLVIFILVTKA